MTKRQQSKTRNIKELTFFFKYCIILYCYYDLKNKQCISPYNLLFRSKMVSGVPNDLDVLY